MSRFMSKFFSRHHVSRRHKATRLKAKLAIERRLVDATTTRVTKETGDIIRNRESWVRMWVDGSYAVHCDQDLMTAQRGITDDGQIIWLVRHPYRSAAYHAVAHDPAVAFARAANAWRRCDALRDRLPEIRALARDVVLGRVRLSVRLEDAAASPLSAVEIRGFMQRFGMSRTQAIPGRLALALMLVEPQVGFVLWHARNRANAPETPNTHAVPAE